MFVKSRFFFNREKSHFFYEVPQNIIYSLLIDSLSVPLRSKMHVKNRKRPILLSLHYNNFKCIEIFESNTTIRYSTTCRKKTTRICFFDRQSTWTQAKKTIQTKKYWCDCISYNGVHLLRKTCNHTLEMTKFGSPNIETQLGHVHWFFAWNFSKKCSSLPL